MTGIRLHAEGFIAREDKSDDYYDLPGVLFFCDPEPPARIRRRITDVQQALLALGGFILACGIAFTFIRMAMLIYRVSKLIEKSVQ